MITNNNIWMIIAGTTPLFASVTWIFLLVLGLCDSKTKTERGCKIAFLHYLIAFTIGYSLLMLYIYLPCKCNYFAPLIMAAFMFNPVLFYRLIWLYTDNGKDEPFPYIKHLSITIVITLILSVWFLFTPTSIQSDMIAGSNIGSDYQLLSVIFRCRPIVLLGFISIYVFLFFRRLIKYNRTIQPTYNPWRPIDFTVIVSFMVPVVSGLLLFTPQHKLLTSPLTIILMMFFVVLHSIIGYNIICNNFIIRKLSPIEANCANSTEVQVITPKRVMRQIAERVETEEGKIIIIPLTRKRFEEYIKEQKPYLNTDLKITDMIDPLKANRTVISNFINKTYALNFNQYINQLRTKELDRLKKLPQNADKDIAQLLSKAGFSSMRNYKRAIAAQQNNQTTEKE